MSNQKDQQPNMPAITEEDSNQTASKKTKANNQVKPKTALNKNTLIAGLALCIAVIGSGAAIGLSIWQGKKQTDLSTEQSKQFALQLNQQKTDFKQQLTDSLQQQDLLKDLLAKSQLKTQELANTVATLRASQQNLTTQISKVSVDSSQTWMLFEAKQLLKQAFLRLQVADINGAIRLLEDIKTIIKEQGDLSLSASKVIQSIETSLLKLQQVEQVDKSGLYSELSAIQQQIIQLKPKQPIYKQQVTFTDSEEESNRWTKLSDKLSSYVRIDFNANSQTLPLLSSQGVGQLKMALDLSVEKAKWAVLNGESQIYVEELNRVTQLLEQYFDADSTAVKAITNKITQLETKAVITAVPDISDTLLVINSYLDEQIKTKQQSTTPSNKGGNDQ